MPQAAQDVRTFFVTTVTGSRRRLFQVHATAELLMDVLTDNRAKGRLAIHSFVIMPDHVHLLLTPAPDVLLEKAMQFIKGGFSFRLKSKMDVWERSFQEHRIKDRADCANHVSYSEANPVADRLVGNARDYLFSSASRRDLVDPGPSHLA